MVRTVFAVMNGKERQIIQKHGILLMKRKIQIQILPDNFE